MKNYIIAIAALGLSGCATTNQQNATAFLKWCADHNIAASNVSQTTRGPWYNHTETLSGITKDNEQFKIDDLKANLVINIGGVPTISWDFSADNITISKADLAALPSAATTK